MIKSIIKFNLIIFLIFSLNACGFKPMYKLSENSIDFRSYSVAIINEDKISREIKEEFEKSFPANDLGNSYVIEVNVTEHLDPLIINTDGTISKYRIEIIINFKVNNKDGKTSLMEDRVRGFAQYSVETSEIESEDKKKRMIRTATNSAIQMMISRIQSDTSATNDN